jgi:hypothetical protein
MRGGKRENAGRRKGSVNKATKEIRESFQKLVENNLEQLQTDLQEMSGKDRVKTILELARFVIPTLKAVESSSTTEANIKPIIINLGEGIDPNHI